MFLQNVSYIDGIYWKYYIWNTKNNLFVLQSHVTIINYSIGNWKAKVHAMAVIISRKIYGFFHVNIFSSPIKNLKLGIWIMNIGIPIHSGH